MSFFEDQAIMLSEYRQLQEEAEPRGRTKGDIASVVLSNIFLFCLIFGLSATVDLHSMKKQMTNKFAIFTGVAMQFLIMPVLGFLAVIVLSGSGLTYAMALSLLVVTSSPGGSYSNWWCSTFNAELSLSVAMTTVSSLLSIGLLPANLFLYTYLAFGKEGNVVQALNFKTIFTSLGIVMGAIVAGLAAGYKWDNAKFHVWANRFGSVSGLLLILFSVFLSSGVDGAESNFWNQPWAFYVGVAFPCLVGIALATVIARSLRLSPPETVAISIECAYQNTGIATSVAITMFTDVNERAQAVAVPLFYGIVEAVAIAIYCVWAWKVGWTKAPKDEHLCVVVTKTYEVGIPEEVDVDFQDGLEPAASSQDDLEVFVDEPSERGEDARRKRGFLSRIFGIFSSSDKEDDELRESDPEKQAKKSRRRLETEATVDSANSSSGPTSPRNDLTTMVVSSPMPTPPILEVPNLEEGGHDEEAPEHDEEAPRIPEEQEAPEEEEGDHQL